MTSPSSGCESDDLREQVGMDGWDNKISDGRSNFRKTLDARLMFIS